MKVEALKIEKTLDSDMLSFLSLAQQLLSFLQHENAIFLDRGALSYEGFLKRKQALLCDFESMAGHLIHSLCQDHCNKSHLLTAIVQDQLEAVKDAVRVNTSLHTESLRKATMGTEAHEGALCH